MDLEEREKRLDEIRDWMVAVPAWDKHRARTDFLLKELEASEKGELQFARLEQERKKVRVYALAEMRERAAKVASDWRPPDSMDSRARLLVDDVAEAIANLIRGLEIEP